MQTKISGPGIIDTFVMQVNAQSRSNKLNSTQNLLITVLEVLARTLHNECDLSAL